MDNKLIGAGGEYFATSILYSQGYDIIKKNFRCKIGEIDIICQKKDCLYFIEVKTRTSLNLGRPGEAVDIDKQRRIRGIAKYYMLTNGITNMKVSFQVIEIFVNQIQNAF